MLNNELNKILKVSDKITKQLIDLYVIKNVQQDAFLLLEKIHDKNATMQILSNLEEM